MPPPSSVPSSPKRVAPRIAHGMVAAEHHVRLAMSLRDVVMRPVRGHGRAPGSGPALPRGHDRAHPCRQHVEQLFVVSRCPPPPPRACAGWYCARVQLAQVVAP
jgi:hypothetical protein